MPGDTYTSAEVAALIKKLKTANDPNDNVTYSEEEIPALMRGIRMHPEPLPLEEGERVMSTSPKGLPAGARVVAMPTQVFEPRGAQPVPNGPQFDIEFGEGRIEYPFGKPPTHPGATAIGGRSGMVDAPMVKDRMGAGWSSVGGYGRTAPAGDYVPVPTREGMDFTAPDYRGAYLDQRRAVDPSLEWGREDARRRQSNEEWLRSLVNRKK